MDIQNISGHIRFSRPMADGAWKSVELGAEGTLSPGEEWNEAQVALYHELGATMKYVFSGTGSGRAPNGPETPI
jgi:hypothetical protein